MWSLGDVKVVLIFNIENLTSVVHRCLLIMNRSRMDRRFMDSFRICVSLTSYAMIVMTIITDRSET